MQRGENKAIELTEIAQHLTAARSEKGLSQAELAERSGLQRQQINYFETGARTPSLGKLLQIARVLDLPLQRFLSGSDRPSDGVPDIAIELRSLGLIDLWVKAPVVPGAFRRPEEIVARAVAGKEPEARIVEGIPAILAWNRWHSFLLLAFARERGRATVYRLAWLADAVLSLERTNGFPGGCPGKEDLAAFVKRVKKPPPDRWDDLGRPAHEPPRSPLWKRWRINYAASLATFRQRAEDLMSLAKAEGAKVPRSGGMTPMEKSEIARFLQAIDEALAVDAREGERLDLYLLGRAALIVRYGLSLATRDVDLVTRGDVPQLQARAFELFGKGTSNALKWGLYLEGVPEGLPPVPGSYRRLSVELPGDWKVLRPKQLDPHDLAITKLKRFHAGDREDLRILCDSGDLTTEGLNRALLSAYPFGMDEEEDPDCKRVNEHFRKVIYYLEGRSSEV